jgi:hypothetical protein
MAVPKVYMVPSIESGNKYDTERQKHRVLKLTKFLEDEVEVECFFLAEYTFSGNWCQWVEDQVEHSNFICLLWTPATERFVYPASPSAINWSDFQANEHEYLTGYSISLIYKRIQLETENRSARIFLLTFEEDEIDTKTIPVILGRQPLVTVTLADDDSFRTLSSYLRDPSKRTHAKPARGEVGETLLLPGELEHKALESATSELDTGKDGWRKYKFEEYGRAKFGSRKYCCAFLVVLMLYMLLVSSPFIIQSTQESDTISLMTVADSLCSLRAETAMKNLRYAGAIVLMCWGFISIFFCCCLCRCLGCWAFGRDAIRRETTARRLIQGPGTFFHVTHLTKMVFGGLLLYAFVTGIVTGHASHFASYETIKSDVSCALKRGMDLYGNSTAKDYYDPNVFDALQFIQLNVSFVSLRCIQCYTNQKLVIEFGRGCVLYSSTVVDWKTIQTGKQLHSEKESQVSLA